MININVKSSPDYIRYREMLHYDAGLHSHDDLQITIALEHSSCEVTWAQEDGNYEQKMISAGRICIIPPMLEHRLNWINKAHFINLHIKAKTICSVLGDLYDPDEVHLQEIIGIKDDFVYNIGYWHWLKADVTHSW